MKLRSLAPPILLALALACSAREARAESFAFTYEFVRLGEAPGLPDLVTSASGILTTTDTEVNGALLITGISGTRTTNSYLGRYFDPPETDTIVGLLPVPGPDSTVNPPWDNLLYPNSTGLLDSNGFAFMLNCSYCGSNGNGFVQVDFDLGRYYELGGTSQGGPGTFTITPIPEPRSFAMFALAASCVLLGKRRLTGKRASTARSLSN